jgi:peptide-methionine (S)-S-oxide reductase
MTFISTIVFVSSSQKILDVFWDRHDPTQKNRQGNDVGTQYRGGIYYHSLEQRMEAEASMKVVQSRYNVPLATELLSASTFWLAEDYHQQYLEKNGQSAKKSATDQIRCYG